jgi:hypothetical protein
LELMATMILSLDGAYHGPEGPTRTGAAASS